MTVSVDLQAIYQGEVPDLASFQGWVEQALAEVVEDCELTIRLVDEAESAQLNAKYRGKDRPTNVLSFPFDAAIALTPKLLGDLVICAPVVEQETQTQHKQLADHWAHLVIHGCLHLLGYDHIEVEEAKQMETLEISILQSLAIANPYVLQGEEQ